ncbi:branched-chain amino acid ABC transporter permease [Agrococcus baldri]|uniref:Branched-chain amino acid ABC transporter permease n=1 Tax=Agrococcus baldri TaxID=153730 RepID=A0AA87URK3_9MICO|nr:branched-chain amino acid ABC transporter permease [Agrococcus baldri]GEK79634.1 branched-chain amino acid ABC transporter permease [Agrococcus baldri]
MEYFATLIIVFSVAAIAALALNISVGYAGQLTMTHGALMAVGAYSVGIIANSFGLNSLIGIVVGLVAGGVVGVLFSLAAVRLSDYDFVLVSLILQMMLIEVIRRGGDLTGGSGGIGGIAAPELFGLSLAGPIPFALFALVVLAVVIVILVRVGHSPFALSLRGFRDSQASIAALGKSTVSIRLSVGAIAGLGAGLGGALQASYLSFISPISYTEFLSFLMIIYLLVGGIGNIWGPLVGVAVLIAVPEIIRNLDFLPTALAAPFERIVYGLVVIGFVIFLPRGIIPERSILKFAKIRKAVAA